MKQPLTIKQQNEVSLFKGRSENKRNIQVATAGIESSVILVFFCLLFFGESTSGITLVLMKSLS